MKKLFLNILTLSIIAVSCNTQADEASSNESSHNTDVSAEEVEVTGDEKADMYEEDVEDYADYSIQGQWDDLVFQIGTGNPDNISIYIDEMAATFSEQEWSYVDITTPEFKEAFDSYESFYDLPEATYFEEGARVVTVNHVYEEEGMTFESSEMIFIVERDGLLWIIGAAMAG